MNSLHTLLRQNQTNLDRLRARARYASSALAQTPNDFHRQYGPYAAYWDEWYAETEIMLEEISGDIALTEQFVTELREFVVATDRVRSLPRSVQARQRSMDALAKEALSCQADMLRLADERITAHREFTKQLELVEAIDSLNEE